jgi:uncharacterized protein YwgA
VKSRDVVLLLIEAYGGIRGRTLLQKICYFADVKVSLGLGFRPHYYGPYSATVEEALGELKALGFVSEEIIGYGVVQNPGFGEFRRYDYRLTKDGERIVNQVKANYPDIYRRISEIAQWIKDCGNPDYRELSLAAKTCFILKKQDKPVTFAELEREARKFNWDLPTDSINKAVECLNKLRLAKSSGQ